MPLFLSVRFFPIDLANSAWARKSKYTKWTISYLTAGALEARLAERELARQQDEIFHRGPKALLIPQGIADRLADASSSRRKTLEEKARANLAALTISASFTSASITLASSHPGLAMMLMFPLVSFGLAAYASVRVLQIGQVFTLTVEEQLASNAPQSIVWLTELNDFTNSNKANWVSVSFDALRNAVTWLVLLAGVATVALWK